MKTPPAGQIKSEHIVTRQTIVVAGNTQVPAYLTLIKLGYDIDLFTEGDNELRTAKNERCN